jgi:hypothetical protein
MAKVLKAVAIDKCNGCELCVLEAQRQLEKVGLDAALIRVFTSKEDGREYPTFCIDIDPRINSIDIERIKSICPKFVFKIEEE